MISAICKQNLEARESPPLFAAVLLVWRKISLKPLGENMLILNSDYTFFFIYQASPVKLHTLFMWANIGWFERRKYSTEYKENLLQSSQNLRLWSRFTI